MSGRWPANVILSPGMAESLDQQSGISKSTSSAARGKGAGMILLNGFNTPAELKAASDRDGKCPNGRSARLTWENYLTKQSLAGGHDDEGGASRFFLTAGYEPWELEWIIANGLTPCGT